MFADKLTAWKEFNGREEETILTLFDYLSKQT